MVCRIPKVYRNLFDGIGEYGVSYLKIENPLDLRGESLYTKSMENYI